MNKPRHRFQLIVPTFAVSVLIVLVALVAMHTQFNFLFWILGVLVAVVAVSLVLSTLMVRALSVQRLDPRHGSVGEPLVIRYRIHHRFRWLPVFNVYLEELPIDPRRDALPADDDGLAALPWQRVMRPVPAWVMHAAPGETTHTDAVYHPRARGRIRFHTMRAWTEFPFGVVRRVARFEQPQHTLIYPRLYRLRREVITAAAPDGFAGSRSSRRIGAGEEYFGLRESRIGDSPRNISWTASARLNTLICVDRTEPSPPRLRILLNLTRPTNALRVEADDWEHRRALEEDAISLAASLVYNAHDLEFEVGLTIAGLDLPVIPVRRSRWHVSKMLALLAGIDLDAPRTAAAPGGHAATADRAGLIVVHPDRVEADVAPEEAFHLKARQLERLAEGTVVWDPGRFAPGDTEPSPDRTTPMRIAEERVA